MFTATLYKTTRKVSFHYSQIINSHFVLVRAVRQKTTLNKPITAAEFSTNSNSCYLPYFHCHCRTMLYKHDLLSCSVSVCLSVTFVAPMSLIISTCLCVCLFSCKYITCTVVCLSVCYIRAPSCLCLAVHSSKFCQCLSVSSVLCLSHSYTLHTCPNVYLPNTHFLFRLFASICYYIIRIAMCPSTYLSHKYTHNISHVSLSPSDFTSLCRYSMCTIVFVCHVIYLFPH